MNFVKFFLSIFSIFSFLNVRAESPAPEKVTLLIKVKDLESNGYNKEAIKKIFEEQISLNDEELLRVNVHEEDSNVIISTFDNIIRSVPVETAKTPRNLVGS